MNNELIYNRRGCFKNELIVIARSFETKQSLDFT